MKVFFDEDVSRKLVRLLPQPSAATMLYYLKMTENGKANALIALGCFELVFGMGYLVFSGYQFVTSHRVLAAVLPALGIMLIIQGRRKKAEWKRLSGIG